RRAHGQMQHADCYATSGGVVDRHRTSGRSSGAGLRLTSVPAKWRSPVRGPLGGRCVGRGGGAVRGPDRSGRRCAQASPATVEVRTRLGARQLSVTKATGFPRVGGPRVWLPRSTDTPYPTWYARFLILFGEPFHAWRR